MELLLAFIVGLLLGAGVMWLARGALANAFSALSAEALQRNNQAFLDLAKTTLDRQQSASQNELEKRQLAISELVMPIRSSLEKFEQQVQGVEKARIDAYATLFEQVRALTDGQGQLRKETANLVRALRAPHSSKRAFQALPLVMELHSLRMQSRGFERTTFLFLNPRLKMRANGGASLWGRVLAKIVTAAATPYKRASFPASLSDRPICIPSVSCISVVHRALRQPSCALEYQPIMTSSFLRKVSQGLSSPGSAGAPILRS